MNKKYVYTVIHKNGLKRFNAEAEAEAYKATLLEGSLSISILKSQVCDYGLEEPTGICADTSYYMEYYVCGYGNTLQELLDDMVITLVDQDGEDHACERFEDVESKVQDYVIKTLFKLYPSLRLELSKEYSDIVEHILNMGLVRGDTVA